MKYWMLLLLSALSFGQSTHEVLADTDQGKAALAANQAEVAWYKDPTSEKAKEAFKALVVTNSPKDQEVSGLAGRAAQNGRKLVEAEHKVELVEIAYRNGQTTAIVKTRETSYFRWSNGREFRQTNNPHTYQLQLKDPRRVGGNWLVVSDEFEFQ